MIYVVLRNVGKILYRCDAWELDGERKLRKMAREAGWVPMESEITFNGDMIIWAE